MKWLLYTFAGLLGLIVLGVIVLLVIGGGRGEATLKASLDISKPPPVVFAWITEPARLKSWVSWLIDVQTPTPQTAGVGARQVWVMEDRNNNNQRMPIEAQVTRYERDRLYAADISAPMGFTGVVTYQLQPIDGTRTHLNYEARYRFEHWLAKLMGPLIARSAQQKLDEDMARLKQHIEAE